MQITSAFVFSVCPTWTTGFRVVSPIADSSTDSADCLSKYIRCQTSIIKSDQIFSVVAQKLLHRVRTKQATAFDCRG